MRKRVNLLPIQGRIFQSEKRVCFVITASGTGKTTGAAFTSAMLAFDRRPYWGMIAGPTFDQLAGVVVPIFEENQRAWALDFKHLATKKLFIFKRPKPRPHAVMRDRDGRPLLDEFGRPRLRPTVKQIEWESVRVRAQSAEIWKRWRGFNNNWTWLDELVEMPPMAMKTANQRMRVGPDRKLIVTTTPNGHDFQYDYAIDQPANNPDLLKSRDIITGYTTLDNPYFDEEYIDDQRRDMDPELFKQEILGLFIKRGVGVCAHQFDREKHVKEIEYVYGHPLLVFHDYNILGSALVGQMIGGCLNILWEVSLPKSWTPDVVKEVFKQAYFSMPRDLRPLRWIIGGDATGRGGHSSSKVSNYTHTINCYKTQEQFEAERESKFEICTSPEDIKETERAQIRHRMKWHVIEEFRTFNPTHVDSVNSLNAMLYNAAGEVRVKIHPRCKKLLVDMEYVSWKPNKMEIDKSNGDRGHLFDCFRYMCDYVTET